MEFTEFAQKIKPIIGGSYSTHVFTRTLFEAIITEDGVLQIEDISKNTFKAYYNGQTKITKISQRILPHIDPEQFISYLDGFPEAATQRLCDAFESDIEGIDLYNATEKIAYYFEGILTSAASQKRKSTPKSAEKDSETDSIEIPEEQTSDEYPYSSEDKMLLQEFTSDYDEIMVTIVGENYAASLIDMTVPSKIQDLYKSKWSSKADDFLNPTLKSYVFGLLGELNSISNSFLTGSSSTPFSKSARAKIRNLYVKLHPDRFAGSFPYEAFIDDWNDGEF
jgi:hypothetical protein